MNTLVVVFLAVAVAVQAKPYYGVGLGGMGAYGSGGGYGESGYGGGQNGFLNQGHGTNIQQEHHNLGHVQNDFDSDVHHHQSSDHNIGGMSNLNNAGHLNSGYGGYNQGHNMFGNGWNHGIY